MRPRANSFDFSILECCAQAHGSAERSTEIPRVGAPAFGCRCGRGGRRRPQSRVGPQLRAVAGGRVIGPNRVGCVEKGFITAGSKTRLEGVFKARMFQNTTSVGHFFALFGRSEAENLIEAERAPGVANSPSSSASKRPPRPCP